MIKSMSKLIIKLLGGYTSNEYNEKLFELALSWQCIIETAKLNTQHEHYKHSRNKYMKATEQIIKDGIEGGWDESAKREDRLSINMFDSGKRANLVGNQEVGTDDHYFKCVIVAEILLDPNFWQAVGKTRGWKKQTSQLGSGFAYHGWRTEWKNFYNHLADGLSIEDSLTAISNNYDNTTNRGDDNRLRCRN